MDQPDETFEEALKRLGIRDTPEDHPIYKQGWSIAFVPRSKQNPRPAPQESQPEQKPEENS